MFFPFFPSYEPPRYSAFPQHPDDDGYPFFQRAGGRKEHQPRGRSSNRRTPSELFFWDEPSRRLIPVQPVNMPAQAEEQEEPAYFADSNPETFFKAPRPRAVPLRTRSPYFTSAPYGADALPYELHCSPAAAAAAAAAARAPQPTSASSRRQPRVSIPSSSKSSASGRAVPLKGYPNPGVPSYSEMESEDEDAVGAGSEAAGEDEVADDDTLVDPSEFEPGAVSLKELLKQQQQAQQAQAEAQARERALQQQRQSLLRQQQRAMQQAAQAQQAQQAGQVQQAAQAAQRGTGPVRIPVHLVSPGALGQPASGGRVPSPLGPSGTSSAHTGAKPAKQMQHKVVREPSTELALSPQPSGLLQALSALLSGQDLQQQQQHQAEQQQAQRAGSMKMQMTRSAAARVFQKVWRGRYLARQRPALRELCRVAAKLRMTTDKLAQYTADGSGLNHKQFLELNELAMQAVLGLDNLPWQGDGSVPSELRAIKKQLTGQAMALQDQVDGLCSASEKTKALTKPDLGDPPEEQCRVRVQFIVEGPQQQPSVSTAAEADARPAMADGSTQTEDLCGACSAAGNAAVQESRIEPNPEQQTEQATQTKAGPPPDLDAPVGSMQGDGAADEDACEEDEHEDLPEAHPAPNISQAAPNEAMQGQVQDCGSKASSKVRRGKRSKASKGTLP